MADTKERKIPAPPVNPETQAFWDAAAQGQAAGQASARACGELHSLSARASARSASATRPSGCEASGRGTIYSYSVMRRAPVPYAIAYVTLAEGADA